MIDNYKGLLRIEVRLTKPKAIRAFIGDASPTEQIASLSEQCKDIFLTAITKIIPYGDFYKKEDALEIIHREIQDAVLRRRMIRLVALIPEKKSLLLAQKELNYRHVDIIMDAFAKINLCPVTISKRQEIKHLENFYDYLC